MLSGLEAGYALDRLWHSMQGDGDRSKRPALLALARVPNESGIAYAVIGGVALQVHPREPRMPLDIDVAVRSRAALPRASLGASSSRWVTLRAGRGPSGVPPPPS